MVRIEKDRGDPRVFSLILSHRTSLLFEFFGERFRKSLWTLGPQLRRVTILYLDRYCSLSIEPK